MFTVRSLKKAITNARSHEELKEIGKKIYSSSLSDEKRHEVVTAYREKRRDLDRQYANTCDNQVLKRILYRVNTMPADLVEVAKLGHLLYHSEAMKTLSGFEREIVWRAFRYQKAKRLKLLAEHEENLEDRRA